MLIALAHLGARGGFFFLGPLLFFLLFGLLLFWVARRGRRDGVWMAPPSAGLGVLEERYAKGEIERDEYLAKRADLDPRRRDKKNE
jgi:putative membrane protein